MQPAIIVEGGKIGTLVQICSQGQCKVHRAPSTRTAPGWQQQRAEQERQRQQEEKQQQEHFQRNKLLFESVLKKVPARLGRADYQMIVDGFIQALSHEDFEALAEYHRIDTDQIQTEEDLADVLRRRTQEMTEPKLKQMLVELCLLPYGYSYRELPDGNPLVITAQRYGVKLSREAPRKAAATKTATGKSQQPKTVRAKAGAKGAGA